MDVVETLTRAQAGEQEAIDALISEFGNDVRFVCLEFQLDQIADLSRSDLLQEAWIKIDRFQINGQASDGEAQFKGWLRRVARNEMCSVLERRQAKKRNPSKPNRNVDDIDIQDQDDTPKRLFSRKSEIDELTQALQRISAPGRLMIEGCFFEGKSVKELAVQLALPYSKARRQLAAALAELQNQLGQSSQSH